VEAFRRSSVRRSLNEVKAKTYWRQW